MKSQAGTSGLCGFFDSSEHVVGPFFHGTKTDFAIGDELVAGCGSNYHEGPVANHVYFAALLEPAIWGAELAVALGGATGREHIFVVEPTGPFEDDPNVTNKRFPGNVTPSFRTRHPMRIVGEVARWDGHPPKILRACSTASPSSEPADWTSSRTEHAPMTAAGGFLDEPLVKSVGLVPTQDEE